MPVFFFDLQTDGEVLRDPMGADYADAAAARVAALDLLANTARDCLQGGDRRDFIADVRDADGRYVYTATLTLVGRSLAS